MVVHFQLHKIAVIVVLCLAVLFISGIVLPKFLASQFFTIRLQLIAHENKSIPLNSSKYLPILSESNSNITTKTYENTKTAKASTNIPFIMKEGDSVKRFKRQIPPKKKELLTWNFNVSIRRDEHASMTEIVEDEKHSKNYLGMAIYMEGKNAKEENNELQNAWKSVGDLMKNIFGKELENVQGEKIKHADDEHIYSVSSDLRAQSDSKSDDSDTEKIDQHTEKSSTESSKRREPKFLLGLFGFGGSSSQKSAESSTEIVQTEPVTENVKSEENNFRQNELTNVTEPEITDGSEIRTTPLSSLENISISSVDQELFSSNENSTINNEECFDCSFDLPTESAINITKDVSEMGKSNQLSGDDLGQYCMGLLNKLEESQSFITEFDHSTPESNQKKQASFDIFSLVSALEKKKAESDASIIEDSFLLSDLRTASTQSPSRESWFSGFGVLRSALLDIQNSERQSEEINEGRQILPSISECETYFRENTKMFPKPNLMDMLVDPNINLADFANATISSKLKEQQLQFLTDSLQTSLNTSFEKTEAPTSESTAQIVPPEISSNENKRSSNEITTKLNEPKHTTSETVSETVQEEDASEMERNPRLFSAFGSGDGPEKNKTQRLVNLNQIIFDTIFGSGAGRSIDESNMELGSGDSRSLDDGSNMEFGSGEMLNELTSDGFLSNDLRIFNWTAGSNGTTVVQDSRFLNFLGLGSGGRELAEDLDLLQTESTTYGHECENDCLDSNETELAYECNDCNLESISKESTLSEDYEFNEHVCENDCSITLNENYTESTSFAISNVSNVTRPVISNLDCNDCINEDDFYNETEYSECLDDCGFDNSLASEISLVSSESTQSSNFADHENSTDCTDCNYEDNFNEVASEYSILSPETIHETFNFRDENSTVCTDCNYDDNFNEVTSQNSILSPETVHETFNFRNENSTVCNDCDVEDNLDKSQSLNSTENIKFKNLDIENASNSEILENKTDSGKMTQLSSVSEPSSVTQPSSENVPKTTETKDSRFINNFFMPGSGNGETINLIEEDKVVSPRLSRRGRLLDFDDVPMDPCDDCDVDINELLKKNNPEPLENDQIFPNEIKDFSSTSRALSNFGKQSTSTQISLNLDILRRSGDVETRFCHSASECNSALNERCVRRGSSSVCSCSDAFVKQKETGKCLLKTELGLSLKLPGEEFSEDLRNPASQKYKDMEDKSLQTIRELLNHLPELIPTIVGVRVTGFSAGSLVVNWNLVLATENDSALVLAEEIEKDFEKILNDETLIKRTSLNINEASMLPITSPLDPCSRKELNYCSINADCYKNISYPGGYFCRCKEYFVDASKNKLYKGEHCEAICPADYCGNMGHCELMTNGERRCLCSGWYFGERCGISGVVVVATFSANVFIIVVVILTAVLWKTRSSRSRSYGGNRGFHVGSEEANTAGGRVSDVIALEENIGAKAQKIVKVSTPRAQPPVIMVTRPTLSDSSLYDSSFDVTSPESQGSMQKVPPYFKK